MKWFAQLKDKLPTTLENKKKLVILLLLAGMVLMLFPTTSKKQTSNSNHLNTINQTNPTQRNLEKLLSDLTGYKVKVLLSYQDNGEIQVIQEENTLTEIQAETSKSQLDSKPILDSDKNVIIKNRLQPKIKGVCIFYFGPYDPTVEDALCRGAAAALGAKLHTVQVLFQS